MARKPLIGTVEQNWRKYGTGALNIDGCRVGIDPLDDAKQLRTMNRSVRGGDNGWGMSTVNSDAPQVVRADGRWPANILHDGSDEVLALFPQSESGAISAEQQVKGGFNGSVNCFGTANRGGAGEYAASKGSAARYFYCAKASAAERHDGLTNPGAQFKRHSTLRDAEKLPAVGNHHPTVKPTDLMAYLCRLVTPPGGTVLDPFMGSGSTGRGALLEKFNFIGIDMDPAYVEIARHRIRAVSPLFAEVVYE